MKPYFEANLRRFKAYELVLPLVELAQQRGLVPDKALKGSKLFYTDLNNSECKVSFEQICIVISNVSKHLPCDGLSFLLGQHLLNSLEGPAFKSLLHAKNLRNMFRVCQLCHDSLFPYMYTDIYRSSGKTHFICNFSIAKPSRQVQIFFFELLASLVIYLCKWRFSGVRQLEIKFPYDQPKYIEQFHAHMPCNYQFSHPCFMFTVQDELLSSPQSHPVLSMSKFYLRQLGDKKTKSGFVEYISAHLKCVPKATSEQIALRLEMSTATFKRKLKQHNVCFKELKDEYQKQHALINILERGYSNEQAAVALAFNDLTNFRRAFKRWTGKTPSEIRMINLD